jgi:hypothetical protein
VPWPFKKEEEDRTEAFAKDLFAVHESWDSRIDSSASSDRTRALLFSGMAGATVACGAHGAMLRELVAEGGAPDRIVRFAGALDNRQTVEAAYRVVAWALVSEYAANLWPEDHEHEIGRCEIAFGFQNIYEETAVGFGQPSQPGASDDEQLDRIYDLTKATLYGMFSAALDEPVVPEDDAVNQNLDAWVDQFEAGIEAGAERLEQLAPDE